MGTEPGTAAYANETHELALTLWDDAVPWRYFPWRRKRKEVYRRLVLHREALGQAVPKKWRRVGGVA